MSEAVVATPVMGCQDPEAHIALLPPMFRENPTYAMLAHGALDHLLLTDATHVAEKRDALPEEQRVLWALDEALRVVTQNLGSTRHG